MSLVNYSTNSHSKYLESTVPTSAAGTPNEQFRCVGVEALGQTDRSHGLPVTFTFYPILTPPSRTVSLGLELTSSHVNLSRVLSASSTSRVWGFRVRRHSWEK